MLPSRRRLSVPPRKEYAHALAHTPALSCSNLLPTGRYVSPISVVIPCCRRSLPSLMAAHRSPPGLLRITSWSTNPHFAFSSSTDFRNRLGVSESITPVASIHSHPAQLPPCPAWVPGASTESLVAPPTRGGIWSAKQSGQRIVRFARVAESCSLGKRPFLRDSRNLRASPLYLIRGQLRRSVRRWLEKHRRQAMSYHS